jgi:hypothetical protein
MHVSIYLIKYLSQRKVFQTTVKQRKMKQTLCPVHFLSTSFTVFVIIKLTECCECISVLAYSAVIHGILKTVTVLNMSALKSGLFLFLSISALLQYDFEAYIKCSLYILNYQLSCITTLNVEALILIVYSVYNFDVL